MMNEMDDADTIAALEREMYRERIEARATMTERVEWLVSAEKGAKGESELSPLLNDALLIAGLLVRSLSRTEIEYADLSRRAENTAMLAERRAEKLWDAERECERLRGEAKETAHLLADRKEWQKLAIRNCEENTTLRAKLERLEGAVEVGFAYDTVGAYFVLNTDGMTHDEHRAIPGDGSEFRVLIIADQGRKCECGLRTRLVGDGCEVCNPDLAADLADEGRGK